MSGNLVIDLPVLHPAQLQIALSPARYRIACCGRRFGKSEMAIAIAVSEALVNKLAVWWCVPTHNNALKAWDTLLFYARQIPYIKISLDEKEIKFPDGGSIRVVSMQAYNNVRGYGKLGLIIFDEAAFAEEQAWLGVLEPMLLDTYGRALFISTPNGFNWFWKMYQMGVVHSEEYASFHFTSWDNPYLPRRGLEQMKASKSRQNYAQEIMAEFTDSAGAVFSGVSFVLIPEAPPFDPLDTYVMGVDWGRKHDFTAISVMNANTWTEVKLVRFNEVGFDVQAERIASIVKEYNVSYILAEENGIGIPNVERLQSMDLPVDPFKMTAQSKKPVIEALRLAIDQQTVQLLDIPEANDELYSYRTTVTPGGTIKYGAPEGGFDDTVIARALSYHACGQGVGDIIELDYL